jgi:hypothetical protein
MRTFTVEGTAEVGITIEVEANSEEEALEKAEEILPELTSYCGNGGTDQLVGIDCPEASLSPSWGINYTDAS